MQNFLEALLNLIVPFALVILVIVAIVAGIVAIFWAIRIIQVKIGQIRRNERY